MKMRRGSNYWGNGGENMIAQFEQGDIVRPVGISDFIGVIRDVQAKINKISVAWGGGAVSQHDPDEVQLVPFVSESVRVKMASEVVIETRRGTKISSDFFAEADEPEQYAGNPETHGLDKPRGGGFSIMQNLQKDLAPEALAESKKGPLVSSPDVEEISDGDSGDQNAPDGDMNKAQESDEKVASDKIALTVPEKHQKAIALKTLKMSDVGAKVMGGMTKEEARDFLKKIGYSDSKIRKLEASESLRSRRAMYWMDKGRTYRLTKNEQNTQNAMCPKCRKDMAKEPFTKSEKLYSCPECGFKVPSSKVVTERKVEVEIKPDGTVEVDIEPKEASLKARRVR